MIGSVWITADGRRESGRITAERRSVRPTAGAGQESRADDRIGVDHGRRYRQQRWVTARSRGRERGDYGREAEYIRRTAEVGRTIGSVWITRQTV